MVKGYLDRVLRETPSLLDIKIKAVIQSSTQRFPLPYKAVATYLQVVRSSTSNMHIPVLIYCGTSIYAYDNCFPGDWCLDGVSNSRPFLIF